MSSPAKNQANTPTLNSLLRQPASVTTPSGSNSTGTSGGTAIPSAGYTVSYSSAAMSTVENSVQQPIQQPDAQSDVYYNYRSMAKGSVPGNSYVPDGRYPQQASFQQPQPPPHHQQQHPVYGAPSMSSYPQPAIANGPSSYPTRAAAPVAGQLHGQNKQNSIENEPMVNGVPSVTKGSIPVQGDPSASLAPKHPSVAALRHEATNAPAAGTRNPSPSPIGLAAPSSPASMMRHSPVSPTPVSVYNQSGAYHGQAAMPGNYATGPPSQQQQQTSAGYYDGNYHYGGYGHPSGAYPPFNNGPVPGPSSSGQPTYGNQAYGGNASTSALAPPMGSMVYPGPATASEVPPNQHNQYFGQHMKNSQDPVKPNDSRTSNGPTSLSDTARSLASPAASDSVEGGKDSTRNGSGTPSGDGRHRTATPATPGGGRPRVNGAKESHPSTPAPASPGGASMEDVDSSLSSPSWPRTPMSPAVKGQSSSMGPPAPVFGQASGSSGGSSKDGGANLVARLLGDPVQLGCTPQEWNERRAFYERLVQYCESHGHPVTAQPTVSKQTVDLFRLYMAVRQRGGFEEVTKKKLWRELCTMFGISQSNSASGQLKKQYSRFLFPFECYYDMQGVDPQPILASLESKKKNKAKAAAAAAAAAGSSARQGMPQQSGQLVHSFPPPSQQQQQQQQQGYCGEQFMVPTAVSYAGPTEGTSAPPVGQSAPGASGGYPGQQCHMAPPQQSGPYASGVPYQPVQHHRGMLVVQGQHQQMAGSNEPMANRESFEDRSSQPGQYYPPSVSASASAPTASPSMAQYSHQSRPAYPPAPSSAPDNSARHLMASRDSTGAGDGQATASQVGYSGSNQPTVMPQHSAPPGTQPVNSMPNTGQVAYSGYMVSSSTSGYQASPYSHESVGGAPPPPNQYLTPHAVRYHAPVQSTPSADVGSAPGMISHTYRSNVAPAGPYGAGTFSGPPQSATYASHSQPGDGTSSHAGHQMPGHAGPYQMAQSADAYNTQSGSSYQWSNQRYMPPTQQTPMAQRYGSSAGYSQVAGVPSSVDYSKMPRMVQGGYPRPNSVAYATGPPTMGPAYGGLPPNMSLRQELAAKPVPPGVVPYSQTVAAQSTHAKKEPSPISMFPPGSVEATTFTMRRRRKMLAKDIGSVEAWRLVMALRSGLQSETTWALNSLNILLYDDNSALYFGLASLPGLLETLVEHWRRSLKDILGQLFTIEEVKDPCCAEKSGECELSAEPCVSDVESSSETNAGCERTEDGWWISYDSGLWRRGGGAATSHLAHRADSKCDQMYLPFTSRQRQLEEEVGDNSRSTPTKRRRLGSISSTDQASSMFFFTNKKYEESDEVEMYNNPPLRTVPSSASQAADRCLSISNIVRGLSFIPGNEAPMSKHPGLVRVMAELLLMCHKHTDRQTRPVWKTNGENGKEETGESKLETEDSIRLEWQAPVDIQENLWFWDHLTTVVDDAFVILCNLSTHLDLYEFHQDVSSPLLNALLHWATCRSPTANDPLTAGAHVSPHRYAMEILCKLSVQEKNVDLLLATPPWERIEYLLELLASMLMTGEEIMMREFAVVVVHALCNANPMACAAAALRTKILQHLIMFLEQADASMHQVVQNQGMQALRDNPELIGTSVGMLRRAASSLLFMAKLPACHSKFNRYQQRLLHFTMSHLMDSRVAGTVAEVLYELQKGGGETAFLAPVYCLNRKACESSEPVAMTKLNGSTTTEGGSETTGGIEENTNEMNRTKSKEVNEDSRENDECKRDESKEIEQTTDGPVKN